MRKRKGADQKESKAGPAGEIKAPPPGGFEQWHKAKHTADAGGSRIEVDDVVITTTLDPVGERAATKKEVAAHYAERRRNEGDLERGFALAVRNKAKAPDPGGCGDCVDGTIVRRDPRYPSLEPRHERCSCALGQGIVVAQTRALATPAPPAVVDMAPIDHDEATELVKADKLTEELCCAAEGRLVDAIKSNPSLKPGEVRRRIGLWRQVARGVGIARCKCGAFLIGGDNWTCPDCADNPDDTTMKQYKVGRIIELVTYADGTPRFVARGTRLWAQWLEVLASRAVDGTLKKAPKPVDEEEPADVHHGDAALIAEAMAGIDADEALAAETPGKRPRPAWMQVHEGGKALSAPAAE